MSRSNPSENSENFTFSFSQQKGNCVVIRCSNQWSPSDVIALTKACLECEVQGKNFAEVKNGTLTIRSTGNHREFMAGTQSLIHQANGSTLEAINEVGNKVFDLFKYQASVQSDQPNPAQ